MFSSGTPAMVAAASQGGGVSLRFQEPYDVVAHLLEPLHHHQVSRSFYDDQLPVADPVRNASATDTLGTRIHR